jgi:signal transduction histidine kinase/ligand-binding sensor domain-containing protein
LLRSYFVVNAKKRFLRRSLLYIVMKRFLGHFIKFFGLLILTIAAAGQRLPVRVYRSADGLGSSAVNTMLRDSRGFLWFATRDGLSRFDGLKFTTYHFDKSASPYITRIFERRNGDYLVVAQRGGTFRFNAETSVTEAESPADFSPFLINAERVLPASIGKILEDTDGNLWAAGFNEGLLRLRDGADGALTTERVPLPIPGTGEQVKRVESLIEARDGSFWLTTDRGLFHLFQDGRSVFYESESDTPLKSFLLTVFEDAEGFIWLGTLRGVIVLKPELPSADASANYKKLSPHRNLSGALPKMEGEAVEFTAEDNLYGKQVTAFYQTRDRRIWIAGTGGLAVYSEDRIFKFDATSGIGAYLNDIIENEDGNLWIAAGSGVYKIIGEGFSNFGTTQGLRDSTIHSVYEDADGQIYVVNGDWFVSRLGEKDNKKYFATTRPPPLSNVGATVWTSHVAFRDHENEWWFLTSQKLFRFKNAGKVENLARAAPFAVYDNKNFRGGTFYRMWEDARGDVWFSNLSANASENALTVLRRNGGSEEFHTFGEAENYPSGRTASAFAEDRRGNIWFGFYQGGLASWRDERFRLLTTENGLPAGFVTALHIDRAGRLWMATSEGGLALINETGAENPQIIRYTTAEGLASNNVRAITEDDYGRIYAGTVRGIDRLTPDEAGGERIQHYSTESGLPDDFITFAYREKSGNLWFGTRDGLAYLKPRADRKTGAPPILIGGLRVAGNKQPVSELGQPEIVLPEFNHRQNNLQIDFFSIGFAADRVRYQYRLANSSEADWGPPTSERTVTFANLAPGDYRFEVRAVNAAGLTSANPATVRFTIAPPTWQKRWFIALCILAAFSGVLAFERYRASKIRALKSTFGELSVSETRFRQLVEQSPLGIMIFNPDGSLRIANQAYMNMWGEGFTFENLRNWDFMNDEQLIAGGVIEGLGRAFAGEIVVFETMRYDLQKNAAGMKVAPDAGVVYIDSVAYPVKNMAGKVREVICVLKDTTEQRIAEENLEKARTEKERELEQVRKRIATDLHDDIGSSLTQISIWSEVLRQNGNKRNGGAEALNLIAASSRELVDAMSDIVWAINPAKDHLSDLTGKMRRFAADSFTPRHLKFTFDVPDLPEDLTLGANLRRELFLIFKEAVNNIVKHAQASAVEILLTIKPGEIRLILCDDGCGFEANGSGDGHGLPSMTERAESLGGALKIDSRRGTGTTIELCVPLNTAAAADEKT